MRRAVPILDRWPVTDIGLDGLAEKIGDGEDRVDSWPSKGPARGKDDSGAASIMGNLSKRYSSEAA
jgi:hypothetical protein